MFLDKIMVLLNYLLFYWIFFTKGRILKVNFELCGNLKAMESPTEIKIDEDTKPNNQLP